MRSTVLASLGVLVAVGGCGQDEAGHARAAGPARPAEVGVITVQPQAVTLTKELPGRTSAFRVAEVRARVDGIVQKRLFTEGSDVKEGQPLFAIDPAPYAAMLDSANAQLARAEANVGAAQSLADRYAQLIASRAISQQEHDDAVARLKAAKADVAAARAAVKSARINVDFTTVRSPLSGRIGRTEVTEGAFVQKAQATRMATVQQIDQVYVDLVWSSTEVMRLRRAIERGELEAAGGQAKVTIVLEDGRAYGTPGALQFADISVDETTGTIALRATVPNPQRELLPGMFVRARIEEGVHRAAILVPQRAVTRDLDGRPIALVVGPDGKVARRALVAQRAIGDAWLVEDGLAAGDRVIVEGLQKARPGATVTPVPARVEQAQR